MKKNKKRFDIFDLAFHIFLFLILLVFLKEDGILIFIILEIALRILKVKKRKYFWKDKKGRKLSLKQFLRRFKSGVEGITPIQQTKTVLWSMIPIFAGVIWGIVMTLMGRTYWLSLILIATLPITTIQFISQLQKYWRLKLVEELSNKAR